MSLSRNRAMTRLYTIAALLLLTFAAYGQDNACLTCHGSAHPGSKAQVIDPAVLSGSVHAGLGCSDCHAIDPKVNHAGNRLVYCGRCHEKEAEGFNKSPHV